MHVDHKSDKPFSIILLGASGRMGQAILSCMENNPSLFTLKHAVVSPQKHHTPFTWRNEQHHYVSYKEDLIDDGDVIIDFSLPHFSHLCLKDAISKRCFYISGVTGFETTPHDFFAPFSAHIPLFHSANMSATVTLLKHLLQPLSQYFPEPYDVDIFERHHKFKKDAPSGTALMLGKAITKNNNKNIHHHHARSGLTVGEHTVTFANELETVSLTHTAHSRHIFAHGALHIVPWITTQKNGLYTFDDYWHEQLQSTPLL